MPGTKAPAGLGVFHSDTLDEHRKRTNAIIPTASAVLAEAVGMRRIRSFSNFNKSRDAACCVKSPPIINLSFFSSLFVSTCHGALALCFSLSLRAYLFLKNQKRALCTSTCVFSRFWEKSGFGEQVGGQARLP